MHHRVSCPVVIGIRVLAGLFVCCLFIGCAAAIGPDQLQIAGADYARAFDTAIEVARRESLIGGLRDRRSGVIETEPAFAPTLLEPWHAVREAPDRLVESTVSFQRRRARFEFVPILAVDDSNQDLTRYQGDLELRVFVFVDRQHTVGRRRSTWTRRVASVETIFDENDVVRRTWVPVGRDPAMERRLMGQLQAELVLR